LIRLSLITFAGVGGVRHNGRERVIGMQRARRLASVAAVATLAVAGLSACRSAPDVAAYVGSAKITEARVSAVFNDAKAKAAAGAQAAPLQRQDVVDTLVGLDVMQVIAKQKGVTATDVPADQVAQSLGLRADAEYVGLYKQYRGLLAAVSNGVAPAKPSTADLKDVYKRLTSAGGNPQGQTFQQFQSGISAQDQQTLSTNIGLRNSLRPQVAKLNTVVNPDYTTPQLPLVSLQDAQGKEVPLVVLPLVPDANQVPVVAR
jgi:hypothetical protein